MKKYLFVLFTFVILLSGCTAANQESKVEDIGQLVEADTKLLNLGVKLMITDDFKKSNEGTKVAILRENTLFMFDISNQEEMKIAEKVTNYQWYHNELYFLTQDLVFTDKELTEQIYGLSDMVFSQFKKYSNEETQILISTIIDLENRGFLEPINFDFNEKGDIILTNKVGIFDSEYWLKHDIINIKNLTNRKFVENGTLIINNLSWSNNKIYYVLSDDEYQPYTYTLMFTENDMYGQLNNKFILQPNDNSWISYENLVGTNNQRSYIYREKITTYNETNSSTDVIYYIPDITLSSKIELPNVVWFDVFEDTLLYEYQTKEGNKIKLLFSSDQNEIIEGHHAILYENKLLYINKENNITSLELNK